jgi:DNA polymerase-3 subunit gamma/tau
MDLIEMDAASNNGVDDIRALRENVKYPPSIDCIRYKVYIIDEVHQLSMAAYNAFLKTLEEPPLHCIFILATTEVQKLPQTILSRCLRFDFRTVSQEQLANHIANIYDKEGVQYEQEALWTIAQAGFGSVRDTLSLADTCMSASDGNVTYQNVLKVLGASDPALIAEIVQNILIGNLASALANIEKSVSAGKNVAVLTKDITHFIRDLLIIKADKSANDYLKLPQSTYKKAYDIAQMIDATTLVRALDIFSSLDGNMRIASSQRTVLENAIARTATISGVQLTDLATRVSGVERKIDDVEERMAKGIVVNTVPVVATTSEQVIQSESKVATDVAVEKLTAVDNPFGEQQESEVPVAVVSTTPDDYMSAKAAALKYKGKLLTLLRERKMFIVCSMVDNAYIYLKDGEITFNTSSENDAPYLEEKRELIEHLSKEVLGKSSKIIFKYAPPKHVDEDVYAVMSQIIGADKITKK